MIGKALACRHHGCCYTPGIYADGYIVFAFPFVRSYVCSFVRLFVLWNSMGVGVGVGPEVKI